MQEHIWKRADEGDFLHSKFEFFRFSKKKNRWQIHKSPKLFRAIANNERKLKNMRISENPTNFMSKKWKGYCIGEYCLYNVYSLEKVQKYLQIYLKMLLIFAEIVSCPILNSKKNKIPMWNKKLFKNELFKSNILSVLKVINLKSNKKKKRNQ